MLFPGAINPLFFKNRAIHLLLFLMRAAAVFRHVKKELRPRVLFSTQGVALLQFVSEAGH